MSKPSTEAEATLGVVKMSRADVQAMDQNGVTILSLQPRANRSAMVTLDIMEDLKKDLKKAILKADEYEAKAALVNAFANLTKSEATLIKVTGAIPVHSGEGSRRAKKAFAAFAPSAPIDVNPKVV